LAGIFCSITGYVIIAAVTFPDWVELCGVDDESRQRPVPMPVTEMFLSEPIFSG